MSTISTSAYYLLPNQLSGNSTQSSASQNTTGSLADALAAADNSGSKTTSTSTNQSYLLNLSPAAQSYLAGLQNGSSSSSSSSSSSASGSGGTNSFLLSPKQREALNSIIAKYKDKPITQDNYNQLQQDLDAAGLAPKQLAVRDQLTNLNPTKFFIDSLNGTDTSNGQSPKFGELTDAQQTQSDNYLKSILTQWQAISTVSTPTTDGAASKGGTTA